jgi:hypothetical protein
MRSPFVGGLQTGCLIAAGLLCLLLLIGKIAQWMA